MNDAFSKSVKYQAARTSAVVSAGSRVVHHDKTHHLRVLYREESDKGSCVVPGRVFSIDDAARGSGLTCNPHPIDFHIACSSPLHDTLKSRREQGSRFT